MADFGAIDSARKALGLNEVATLKEIKDAYRRLSHLHHPDKNNGGDGETMKEINRAYSILMDYVNNYRYSFLERDAGAEFYKEHLKRFYDGGF